MASKLLIEDIVKKIIAAFKSVGIKITVTSTWRSRQEQLILSENDVYSYPVAPAGTSQHEYGLAVDMKTSPYNEYQPILGQVWRALGFAWSESDPIHFAVFDRETWRQILQMIQQPKAEAEPVYNYYSQGFAPSSQQQSFSYAAAAPQNMVYNEPTTIPTKTATPPESQPVVVSSGGVYPHGVTAMQSESTLKLAESMGQTLVSQKAEPQVALNRALFYRELLG